MKIDVYDIFKRQLFFKIVLILDIIAAIEILRSGKPMVEKLLWILFIIFCPIIGKNYFVILICI